MIVVDTNIIAYLYLTAEQSAQAEQVWARDPQWAAPLLWRSEFRNVLAHAMRRGILRPEDAEQIMDAALVMMRGQEYEVLSADVLRLVAHSACSAYDCEFVALAQDLGVPLVTADRQVLQQFPDTAVAMETYLGS